MDSNSVKALIKQRGIYKAALTRMQSFLNNFDGSKSIDEVSCRLENITKVYSQYDEVQTKLEIGDESEDHSQDREAFEEMYFTVVGGLRYLLASHRARNEGSAYVNEHSPHISNNVPHSSNNVPPLPKISLPVFSGDYRDWLSFKDTFQSLVIDNESLSQVQMLHYLNSALKGEAKQLIQGIPISNENFKVAWSLIKTRYDNPRLIAVRHVHELLTPPKVAKNSPTELRQLLNHMTSNKAALEALKLDSSLFEIMLTQITLQHLNTKIREEFEVTVASQETSSWSDLVMFLENRCQALEIVNTDSMPDASVKPKAESNFKNTRSNKSSLTYSALDQTCVCCKQMHYIYRCERFKSLTVPQRLEIVKENKLCFNCLSPSHHKASDCKSGSCRSCGGRHHTLLHAVSKKEKQARSTCEDLTSSTSLKGGSQSEAGLVSYCSTKMHSGSQVLLSTAAILVLDSNNRPHKVRCLLDSCSQSNYITEELVQRLGLKKTKNIVPIEGISGMIRQSKHCVIASILSRVSEFKTDVHCSVLTKITNHLPAHKIDVGSWNLPKDILLADPEFFIPGRIDLLLGTEIFFRILKQNRRMRSDDWPVLQDTELGYILAGRYQSPHHDVATSRNFLLQHGSPIDVQLRKFWELEEVSVKKQTEQDVACEMHFKKNTLRNEDGRFIVRLPRKQIEGKLGNSYFNARNRFHHLERRFMKQPILQQQYCEFMKEYEDLRHMKPADEVREHGIHETYYIPHHAIFKEHSTTTKLRVVFDCSSKSTTGTSLNDLLMVGPVLQEDLYSIVLRFRTHLIAFAADIEKMYRQVLVHPDDLKLQRILWRPNPDLPLRVYELQTLTYGMVPSSYLATRCLIQLADEGADKYLLASRALRQDFYMDDVLSGGRNLQEALQLQSELIELLASGGFPLRKFCSNHTALLTAVPPESRETQLPISFGKEEGVRTLGILWHPMSDNFTILSKVADGFNFPKGSSTDPVTKRKVISIVSSIFDPLGIIGPVVISFKIFLQLLWCHRLEWDEPLPQPLLSQWHSLVKSLFHVKDIKIDRYVLTFSYVKDVQVHAFSDASEAAYGCAIYVRAVSSQDEVAVRLLCAKSRVAPIKRITLPRLELCGALLMARLVSKTLSALNLRISKVFYWTDSTIVLSWLSAPPSRWKTFVSHRVAEIQELSDVQQWRHVSSAENSADLISRGMNAETLKDSLLWWQGAPYLKNPSSMWPEGNMKMKDDSIPERKMSTISLCTTISDEILHRFSALRRLLRVLAYCQRFVHNVRHTNKFTGILSSEELKSSLHLCIKMAQQSSYKQDIEALRIKRNVSNRSTLLNLHPFLDNQGLLRVGGRLSKSSLPFEVKHQIILPPNHHLTRLIIQDEHLRSLHGGSQLLTTTLRERYWIPRIRQTIRSVIHKCLTCFKLKKQTSEQLMGQLPSPRVQPSRPFLNTGVDYTGPLIMKLGSQRSRSTQKCYIALFICLCTKAVHLELVTNLSSQAFIAALRRFVARRGKCLNLYSDNGTNFVGANKELEEMRKLLQDIDFQWKVQEFASTEMFTWHFIPPSAPHFGGLWEANIKSMKHHLRRVVGPVSLTYEELSTLLCQIEACLNSRPLTTLSDNPDDLSPLTPGHFLIGSSLLSLPEVDVTNVPVNKLSRWRRVQQFLQHLWRRWSMDYLNSQQQRLKWKSAQPNIRVGTVVLLKDDRTSPMQWKMGVIQRTHPGTDGLIRVVTVRTFKGEMRRPVHKLVPLPEY